MKQITGDTKIYLVGMMGSGKSYWSGKLGREFGLPAYDLDRLIESAANKSISRIFEEEGADVFRNMEAGILKTGVPGNGFVLATGGGTPCFFDNMLYMKKTGIVIWLNPPIEELVKRLKKGIDTRPVLEGIQSPEALTAHVNKLLEQRQQWYSQADITVTDDIPELAAIVQRIYSFQKTAP